MIVIIHYWSKMVRPPWIHDWVFFQDSDDDDDADISLIMAEVFGEEKSGQEEEAGRMRMKKRKGRRNGMMLTLGAELTCQSKCGYCISSSII